jgi:branched-chain amino acid transport system ATP-binding protein
MAFVAKPKLLIIDELSLGLAPTVVEQLLDMVREIHRQGCTIILVEQSVNVALTVATRAYFLEKGEVRFSGPTAELLERGDILRAVFLQGSDSTRKTQTKAKVPVVVAKRAAELRETPLGERPVLLSVEGLTRRFGGITAVDNVTFDLREGEILGLIGPNGAGKTTIFDLVSGHLPLDGGRLVLGGVDITGMAADRRAALGLGRSFQDARIFPAMTVAENVAMGLERHVEVRDHLSSLLDLPAAQASEDDVAWTVDDLVELMNLGAFRNKFVGELSTGSRRAVDVACIMAAEPKVLLLDEPSSGLAQAETEELGPVLTRVVKDTGCAMLVIEHDLPLITSISDRLIAMELGAVLAVGTPAEVVQDPKVLASYLAASENVIARSNTRVAALAAALGQPHDGPATTE